MDQDRDKEKARPNASDSKSDGTDKDANERATRARKGSPYLVSKEVAAHLRIKPHTLIRMRKKGRGPKFIKDGRFVRYHIADVEEWMRRNPR